HRAHRAASQRNSGGSRWVGIGIAVGVLAIAGAWFAFGSHAKSSQPAAGLFVTSTPPGAALLVDGAPPGHTPVVVPGRVGRHFVRLELDGYRPAEINDVRVPVGERLELAPVLERDTTEAGIEVTSTPPGAAVFIDGAPAGRATLFKPGLAYGAHEVK